ncbi:hypothetical protein [Streptomyces aurantiacus]|uniref:Secreted protein n=1 Tax=Streptomyces aurantiacus TaxID=47760 RepID=A0A7G1NYH2_9ACTN|nr:hypothetical protein [Streptomyces aurantiacus]BCL26684.1 hypothetical protein GCM10017557_15430 [Streptomyces aurantiacus]
MRLRTCLRATVLLMVLGALQSGPSAVADGKGGPPRSGPPAQSASIDPLAPFSQSASALFGMAAPFVDSASTMMFPPR